MKSYAAGCAALALACSVASAQSPGKGAASQAAGARGADREMALLAGSERFQCGNACQGASPTLYCLEIPRNSELGSAFSSLRRRFLEPRAERITRLELMQYFKVDKDPCERSDTTGASGAWKNTGAACRLSGTFDVVAGSAPVPIRIDIPAEFTFTVTVAGEWVTATSGVSPAQLSIQDANFHADWGGSVQSVSSDGRSTLVQVPRGCMKIAH